MATNDFSPAVPEKANDILLGEGAVYKNYDEVGEALIGATKGGSKLSIEKVIKEVEYDGAYGPTKGMRRHVTCIVKLVINFLKLNYTNMSYGVPCTVSDGSDEDGTYKEIAYDLEIVAADVLTNVTFVGQKWDGSYCKIKVENALNIDSTTWEFKSKDNLVLEMTYTGFYSYSTPTVPPLEIDEEVA
jgi:hypothetical protein